MSDLPFGSNLSPVTIQPRTHDEAKAFARLTDLMASGTPVEKAIRQVWPGARARSYMSEVDGSLIGWDTCGVCIQHVSNCRCDQGPSEPKFFTGLRQRAAAERTAKAEERTESARTRVVRETAAGPAHSPVSSTPGVTCKVGPHVVSEDQADRNDDGSWTCHEHQAIAERG